MVRRDQPADRQPGRRPERQLDSSWQVMPPPDVVVVERIAPVPRTAPADVAHSVRPVVDPSGTIVDWSLVDPLAGAGRFASWRHTWERRHHFGTVSDLAALRQVARTVGHVDSGPLDTLLDVLTAATDDEIGSEVPVGVFAAAVDELDDVWVALEVTGGTGTGIFDRMRAPAGAAPIRALAPPDREYVVAATTVSSLVAHAGGGLGLRVLAGDDETRLDRLETVDLTGDTVTARSADGGVLTLGPMDARPLAWVAPSTLRWAVRPIPLVDVWRQPFASASALAGAAPEARVVVTTRVPVG